jgi:hypothetical protein
MSAIAYDRVVVSASLPPLKNAAQTLVVKVLFTSAAFELLFRAVTICQSISILSGTDNVLNRLAWGRERPTTSPL